MTMPTVVFPCPVRRLLIRVRRGVWDVVRESTIKAKTLRKSQLFPPGAGESSYLGFCYEAIDSQSRVLYRRIGNDPFAAGIEYVDEGGVLRCAPTGDQDLWIDVMFPDLPEVEAIRFYSSSVEPLRVDGQGNLMCDKPAASIVVRRGGPGVT